MTIMAVIREQAQDNPEKIVVVSPQEEISLTYKELINAVEQMAEFLYRNNVSSGCHLATVMPNGVLCAVVMLAIAEIGAVWVPMATNLKRKQLIKAMVATDCHYLIDNGLISNVDDSVVYGESPRLPELENLVKSHRVVEYQRSENAEAAFIITMTSGSTGDPKPIVFSQNTKLKRAKAAQELYSLDHNDVLLAATPMYHSLAQRLTLLPLLIGARVVILKTFTPDLWCETVDQNKITFTIAVSNQLERVILEKNINKFRSLKSIVSSSAPLSEESKKKINNFLPCKLHECYGASELGTVTDLVIDPGSKHSASVGKVFSDIEIIIRNDSGEPLPDGDVGEISVKSSMEFLGYYKKQEVTDKVYVDSFFLTGDLGFICDGYLYFSGRKKDIIISSGINIYPKDIEVVVNKYNGVIESAVFGVPDSSFGEVVVCAVVTNNPGIKKRDIRKFCKDSLADHQIPFDFVFLDKLPKSGLGKVKKGDLKDMFKTSRYGGIFSSFNI